MGVIYIFIGEQNSLPMEIEISPESSLKFEIKELFHKFAKIATSVQNELRKMEKVDDSLPLNIAALAGKYRIQVTKKEDIDQLFSELDCQCAYDFLHYDLIEGIIEVFLKGYKSEMENYIHELESYMQKSSSLLDIMKAIEEKLIPKQNGTKDNCKVTIKVPKIWGNHSFQLINQVIRFITSGNLLGQIDVIPGSLIISFLAPISHFLFLVGEATAKIEFMDRIGIIEMYISDFDCDYYIMERQDEENINYDHSLLEAAEGGYDFDVSVLIKLGANINYIHMENEVTALMLASQNGHYQVVELLLKEHADVNHQRQDGATALMLANKNGHYQVVELLKFKEKGTY